MKSIEIKGSLRTETGKKAAHSLRQNNRCSLRIVRNAERRKRKPSRNSLHCNC